ncbi:hypothetical protein RvY_02426 [Ramazzottius varieornatus]|uniref:Uncharacterized protein n=1 Tax=Ramazzottius varieornatus TaxID=947166 RepID=A0A1D1UJM8_RAMVA|nr:hypothetical protein RvY_02426 [Ramazzottius varieornatus]
MDEVLAARLLQVRTLGNSGEIVPPDMVRSPQVRFKEKVNTYVKKLIGTSESSGNEHLFSTQIFQ